MIIALCIAGVTPLLGWATIKLPFTPVAFATGLTIFCLMPTTLGVGVSLVTSAKVILPSVRNAAHAGSDLHRCKFIVNFFAHVCL